MTSISFAVLGSGSKGNAAVLCYGEHRLLVDAGLSVRQTHLRLQTLGLALDDLHGIVLTHLDRDHFSTGWAGRLQRQPLPIYVAPGHQRAAEACGASPANLRCLEDDNPDVLGALRIEIVNVAHDDSGCTAFVFEYEGCRLGWATDLGHVPPHLFDRFVNLDALAFESNYDRTMQLASERPSFLKERIMGGQGHLSNRETLEAVNTIAASSQLQHIALLHMSQQCNHPGCVLELWRNQAAHLVDRLVLTHQDTPTVMLQVQTATDHAAMG